MNQQPDPWTPAWARRAIFYHIYALGFLGAPATNDLSGAVEPRLAKLRRWYDHIAGLGVDAIWMGPVFQSLSHGYDTVDYLTVDRRLGDTALLKQIVDELHGRGIRVILDGVFHHTSREFFAFRDLRSHKRDSRYRDWYLVNWEADSGHGDGFGYECWEGVEELPKLNLDNPDVRRHIFDVARYWLGEVGIDGWRLDVAYCIPPGFWWEFRRVCKEARPDGFLLAELIHGDYRTHVAPDLLDSGTNYQGYAAIWRSLNERNYHELRAVSERAWHPEWGLYKDLVLMNFLGNHDVPRILTQLRDARHIYPALIFLMTAPGIPCLYYGDEVGMREEPRAAMPDPDAEWPDRERTLYPAVARLALIRRSHPPLMFGDFGVLAVSDVTFAYLRRLDSGRAIVALNVDDKPVSLDLPVGTSGIPDGTVFRDELDEAHPEFTVRGGTLHLDAVPPMWGRILVAR
jgi:cyclomaltodextrinase